MTTNPKSSTLNTFGKEALIEQKLKKNDYIELPMDEKFYEKMHSQIMQGIERTEIKPLNRWAKTWVFLESHGRLWRPANSRKAKFTS